MQCSTASHYMIRSASGIYNACKIGSFFRWQHWLAQIGSAPRRALRAGQKAQRLQNARSTQQHPAETKRNNSACLVRASDRLDYAENQYNRAWCTYLPFLKWERDKLFSLMKVFYLKNISLSVDAHFLFIYKSDEYSHSYGVVEHSSRWMSEFASNYIVTRLVHCCKYFIFYVRVIISTVNLFFRKLSCKNGLSTFAIVCMVHCVCRYVTYTYLAFIDFQRSFGLNRLTKYLTNLLLWTLL